MQPLTQLGDLSLAEFMRDYWQKKPVLLRNVLPGWQPPIGPDDLAGLAMESEVESRLVLESYQGKPWQLRNGPFSEADFADLPEAGWTLLVQAVDQWVPEVTALLDSFRFLPNWRLDDVMVSYAPDGASVGPHYDHYDVFLIQGAGKRRWQLGQHCNSQTPRLKDTPLNILTDLAVTDSFELSTGDVLYVPPGIAHWGVALGEAMTYSVGFRAPSAAEIIDDFAAEVSAQLLPEQRFQDPGQATNTPGLIDTATIDRLTQLLRDELLQPARVARWFGAYMTERKYDPERGQARTEVDREALAEADADLADHSGPLFQAPDSRFAYTDEGLFINGEFFTCDRAFASALADRRCIEQWPQLADDPAQHQLLIRLLALGWLWFEDPCEPLE